MGSVGPALAYAVAGSAAASLRAGTLVFAGVVLPGVGFWQAGRRRSVSVAPGLESAPTA